MITYGAFGTVCGVIKWLPNNWEDSIWWSMVGMSLSILGPVIPMFIFASGIGAIYEMAHEKPKAPTSRRK